jgi:hypothetical protein
MVPNCPRSLGLGLCNLRNMGGGVVFIPKSPWERCVRMFVVFFGYVANIFG